MAHPGIRKIAKQIYEVFKQAIPVLVEDIELADADEWKLVDGQRLMGE